MAAHCGVIWIAASAVLLGLSNPHLHAQTKLDPAAWGSDHVGKPIPEFMSGDECLFCHRDVGPRWPTNRHGLTIRSANRDLPALSALADAAQAKSLASQVEYLMGGRNRQRFLKRSAEHGRLDLLSIEWIPSKSGRDGRLAVLASPNWDSQTFANRCAGCHATGTDSATRKFAAASLDCFVCHGEMSDEHTTNGKLVHLSPKQTESAALIASACGQCHLRGGNSKTSGLPFANNFVVGDNLSRDFQVDLSANAIQKLNRGDRHVFENVRDIVLLDKQDVTCLSCHNIHEQSTAKHRLVADSASCLTCHEPESKRNPLRYQVHSATCGY